MRVDSESRRWAWIVLAMALSLGLGLGLGLTVAAEEGDRAALIEGVREITAPGAPGSLAIHGPGAEAVVVGKTGEGAQVAVVALAKAGKGRIVAMGHNGYFGKQAIQTADTGRLLVNAARWAGGGQAKAEPSRAASPRVGVIGEPDVLAHLQAAGLTATETKAGAWAGFDIIVAEPESLGGPAGIAALRQFLRDGGGLITAATGWGWAQIHRKSIQEFEGNALLADSGLAWTEGMADRTGSKGYTTDAPISPATNAATVLDALSRGQSPSDADILNGMEAVRLTLGSLPSGDSSKFSAQAARVLKGLSARGINLVPTAKAPASLKDNRLRRFAIGLETALAQEAPAEQVTALPAAADFPGIPEGKPRPVTRSGQIDTTVPGWQSLGLYAAPGAKITVTVDEADLPLKLTVQIGSHTDQLWHLNRWERLPSIVRRFPMSEPNTVAASAVGGLVYIDVPHGISPPRQVQVTIAGAIPAPLFRLGVTSGKDWRESIRNRPAPWAELAGHRVILTVPTALVRRLDDPEPLLQWWDAVFASQAAFAHAGPRERPERIVADRQISAGYMHSGYPIMVPLDDSTTHALNLAKLRAEGSWGHLHELGHNLQNGDWTFGGTGEVTNNLLVVHTYDALLKLPYDSGHDAIRGKAKRTQRIREHLAAGAPFEKWKSDPFLALMMYIQLYEGFGWKPFDQVFAEYAQLRRDDRPRGDDAKRDMWLTRMSHATGHNLGPFFQAWGVPTSDDARRQLQKLPPWMPAEIANVR